jgi:CopG family transcriptional regulator / antitoxin EndoAI
MRTTKIWNISLPPEMARAAEKTAKEEARTKSELIREALRQYLWGRRWKELRRYGEQKAGERGIREEDLDDLVHEARKAKH